MVPFLHSVLLVTTLDKPSRTVYLCDMESDERKEMPGTKTDARELAAAYAVALAEWKTTGSADSADALGEIENEVCAHLDIPLNETEQGLTPYAESLIAEWQAKFDA